MIEGLLETAVIWRNPVFRRYRRSRLRLRKAVFWYLLTAIVTTFVVTLGYVISTNSGNFPETAARRLWIPLLIIQGTILMIKGTGAVSAGLIQDKIDATLDYQRLTPLTPLQSLVGYLYGLPVLEYVMFALTLPHLAFIVLVGHIPLTALLSVYLAFFVCVTLYHITAIAVGIVMKRWIVGYLLSIFMVLTVNVILPTFISQLGLRFIQYLSVWPVISQKVLPIVVQPASLELVMRNPYFSLAGDVAFYDWAFTPFEFTLTLQSALILTFGLMAYRRWKSASMHSLSKPYAFGFLGGFIVLLIGNIWPAITGQYLPFQIFGETRLEEVTEVIAVGFPVVYCFVCWILTAVLLAIVLPGHDTCVRGLRRAAKLGRRALRPWDDASSSPVFTALFIAAVMAGFWVLYSAVAAAGFFDFRAGAELGLWRLPVAFALILVTTAMLLQVLELRPTVLVVLLLWFLPLLVAIVLGAATQAIALPQAVIASLSPIALLAMAGAVPVIESVPLDAPVQFDYLLTGVSTGLIFLAVQILCLAWRWLGLSDRFRRASGSRAAEEPGALLAARAET